MPVHNPISVANTTDGTIELFDTYKTGNKDDAPVTYTSLGTVAAGATAKINTQHAANHIVAMQTGALADKTMNLQANFPVKVIAVLGMSKDQQFTVSPQDKAAMEQTFRFVRYTSANPDSKLAKQFLDALGEADQTKAVNDFFAASKSFNLCTLSTWTSIVSWQSEFLSAWQGKHYLYDCDPNSKPGTLIAGVEIKLDGDKVTAKLAMADAKGGWTDASQTVELTIAGGVISEADPGDSGISAALKPVWMNVVETEKVNYVLAPALSGTINGKNVVGNCRKIPTSSVLDKVESGATNVINWLDKHVGTLISAGMLYIMFKQWQESKREAGNKAAEKGEGKDPQEVKNDMDAAEADVDAAQRKRFRSAPRPDLQNLKKSAAELRKAEVRVEVAGAVAEQRERLLDILENVPSSDTVEKVAEAVEAIGDAIDRGDVDGAKAKLPELRNNLERMIADSGKKMSADAKSAAKKISSEFEMVERRAEVENKLEQDHDTDKERGSEEEFSDEDFERPKSEPVEFKFAGRA